jgi:hypothetical protein
VNDIAIDESGNVWFATLGGVSKYDGFGWETYTTDDGLAYIYVTEIAANGDDIWISYLGHYGLSHFDGNSWVTYTTADGLPANVFTDIEFDSAGNLWVAFPDGVGYFHDIIWATFPLTANSTSCYASDLAVDSMDNIWTGAYDHIDSEWLGLNHFANNTWTDYTNVGGLLSNEIDNIASHGNVIWFNEGGQAVGKLVQLYGLDERVYLPMIHK